MTLDIDVTFSKPMNPDSVTANSFRLSPEGSSETVPVTVRMLPDMNQHHFRFDPYGSGPGRLEPNKKYNWSVNWVESSDGTVFFSPEIFSFKTAAPSAPTVNQVSPPDGATGVSRGTNVKVTFSEPMDPASMNTSTLQLRYYDLLCTTSRIYDPNYSPCNFSSHQISSTVSKDPADPSGRTWIIDPQGLLYANKRYMVSVTTGVRDIDAGIGMASNKEWYFKTGSY